MKAKYTLIILFVSLLSLTATAQDYKANLKQLFTEYTKYMMAGDFDKSFDYVPESMFAIVPKEQMVAVMEQVMKSKEAEVRLVSFDIKEIADKRKIDSSYYSKMKVTTAMTLKLNVAKIESAEEKAKRLLLMKESFANTHGSDNVKLDEATETFTVITPGKICWAISKKGETGWKFISVEPGGRLLLEKLLPKELVEESFN